MSKMVYHVFEYGTEYKAIVGVYADKKKASTFTRDRRRIAKNRGSFVYYDTEEWKVTE